MGTQDFGCGVTARSGVSGYDVEVIFGGKEVQQLRG